MPKQKTNSAAKKRFNVTGSGNIKRGHQNRRHLLSDKETGRKRNARRSVYVSKTQAKTIEKLVGNQG